MNKIPDQLESIEYRELRTKFKKEAKKIYLSINEFMKKDKLP
jgi:hypothetical protein